MHVTSIKFEAAVRELKSAVGKMDDDDVVMQLLISLPDTYDHVVSALENLSEKELTLEKVKARLLEEELKRKLKGGGAADSQQGAAFNAKQRKATEMLSLQRSQT